MSPLMRHAPAQPPAAGRGPKMFDAGTLRYLVLQLIADQPRHGYDIIKAIARRAGGGYAPSPGAIYPLMHGLVGQGHVAVSLDGNKKLHSITPAGLAFLDANRAYVDAIAARVGDGVDRDDDLRKLMHELKAVVIAQSRDEPGQARLESIRAILRQARHAVEALA
ncbi:PadR family transcriptional regulator [Janthinobacterium psychrotolerans]|uniref:DNA-binding transcriptional regulator, PadR family n=1 Tax=Janthinobacterium psychrotolerans TaxID=1747903 RepID=A0A1A7C540_9BURK|nr:PadR family transcriptional regulator [Janthinobacterium psychrotolerans]OBV39870.1 DNA-binding transcriptional regulator, PadR family [Janthinobacterium psychrotolerans]